MQLHVGTSGFSYKQWRGHFYPEKLQAADFLAFYAERFTTVELNNTFYRLPRRAQVEKWADAVPGDFRFVFKASRRITHIGRLKGVEEPLGFPLRSIEAESARAIDASSSYRITS